MTSDFDTCEFVSSVYFSLSASSTASASSRMTSSLSSSEVVELYGFIGLSNRLIKAGLPQNSYTN